MKGMRVDVGQPSPHPLHLDLTATTRPTRLREATVPVFSREIRYPGGQLIGRQLAINADQTLVAKLGVREIHEITDSNHDVTCQTRFFGIGHLSCW